MVLGEKYDVANLSVRSHVRPLEGAVSKVITASSSKDEAAIDHGVERFVALLRDVQAIDVSQLAPGPLGPAR